MLQLFLSDGQGRISALSASVLAGDAAAIRETAHAFKSGAANVRATMLTDLLQSVETSGDDANIGDARALMPSVEREFDRVTSYLRSQLGAAV